MIPTIVLMGWPLAFIFFGFWLVARSSARFHKRECDLALRSWRESISATYLRIGAGQ